MKKAHKKVFKYFFDKSFIIAVNMMVAALYVSSFVLTPEKLSSKNAQKARFTSQNKPVSLTQISHLPEDHVTEGSFTRAPEFTDSVAIPRVFAAYLPAELGGITNIKNKQEIFVQTLLPHILKHNEDILADRTYLLRLRRIVDSGNSLSFEQRLWLEDLAKRYNIKRVSFEELLKRVDIIPPSLALGQAVVESGWGGCKFARKQNSPFGLMKDKKRLLTFDSLSEGVKTYMDTLNKHPAYDSLRRIRAQQRLEGARPCSLKLADGLLYYSTRRHAYTRQLKQIIDVHCFKKYDCARLATELKS
ncbi:MAG: hypothetical protein BGO77_03975 [Caedibacter sp. 37-49]|nr:MAG: hypothetical protein BGO77_03975 [Caedibacter sp. 37-49]